MPTKLDFVWSPVLFVLGGAAWGCTFYTSCPTATEGANGNGSMAGTGNTSMAGAGNATVSGEAPPGEWTIATPDLSGIENSCGPLAYMSVRPDRDEVLAGIAGIGLWSSADGGASWQPLAEGKGSAQVTNQANQIVYDPADPQTFWEAGSYGPGAFQTENGGQTFRQLGDITHLDSISVDFSDPQRSTLLTSAHEQQLVLKSVDGGETWEETSSGIPAYSKHCRYSQIVDSSTFLLSCGGWFDSGRPATFRSTDAGQTWTEVYDNGGGAAPLVHSDGSIYWADEFNGGLARSTDQGATWTRVVTQTLMSVQPVELPDGRIASLTESEVVTSADSGVTWKKASQPLPFKPVGFVYSSFQKAFFIFYFACHAEPTPAAGDEIMRFDFDFEWY